MSKSRETQPSDLLLPDAQDRIAKIRAQRAAASVTDTPNAIADSAIISESKLPADEIRSLSESKTGHKSEAFAAELGNQREQIRQLTDVVELLSNQATKLVNETERSKAQSLLIVRVTTILSVIGMLLILGQVYLWNRGGPTGPEGKKGQIGNKGDKSDKGEKGDPGPSGTFRLALERDNTQVGDILLADDLGLLPEGFLKCDGSLIYKTQYGDYFSFIGSSDRWERLPKLTAPSGKSYFIRVKSPK